MTDDVSPQDTLVMDKRVTQSQSFQNMINPKETGEANPAVKRKRGAELFQGVNDFGDDESDAQATDSGCNGEEADTGDESDSSMEWEDDRNVIGGMRVISVPLARSTTCQIFRILILLESILSFSKRIPTSFPSLHKQLASRPLIDNVNYPKTAL